MLSRKATEKKIENYCNIETMLENYDDDFINDITKIISEIYFHNNFENAEILNQFNFSIDNWIDWYFTEVID